MVCVADALKNLVGEDNARRGTIKVFEVLQNKTLNKHLIYVSVCGVLSSELPWMFWCCCFLLSVRSGTDAIWNWSSFMVEAQAVEPRDCWFQSQLKQQASPQPLSPTPSLPQPVQFPGWKMHGRAYEQYIFCSYNIYFQCYMFWWKSFHMIMWKIKPETVQGFKFYTFIGRFQVTSWQWRVKLRLNQCIFTLQFLRFLSADCTCDYRFW